MPEFERENRYLVIKRKELHEAMVLVDKKHIEGFEAVCALVEMIRKGGSKPKPTLCCVVVESHWPEYETVWKMMESRVNQEKS